MWQLFTFLDIIMAIYHSSCTKHPGHPGTATEGIMGLPHLSMGLGHSHFNKSNSRLNRKIMGMNPMGILI